MTLSQMFFEINRSLCKLYPGLDPLKLLDYYAEDVFDLIHDVIAYKEMDENVTTNNNGTIRRKAKDNWF